MRRRKFNHDFLVHRMQYVIPSLRKFNTDLLRGTREEAALALLWVSILLFGFRLLI